MVQRLLSSAEFKMDPMVSLYYFAPACAVINGVFTLFVEIPKMSMNDIYSLGLITLLANAFVAFLLNVAVVLLVRATFRTVHQPYLFDSLLICPCRSAKPLLWCSLSPAY